MPLSLSLYPLLTAFVVLKKSANATVENSSLFASASLSALCSSFASCNFKTLALSLDIAYKAASAPPHPSLAGSPLLALSPSLFIPFYLINDDLVQESIDCVVWRLVSGVVCAPLSLLQPRLPQILTMWSTTLRDVEVPRDVMRNEPAFHNHIQTRCWCLQSVCQFLRHPDADSLLAIHVPEFLFSPTCLYWFVCLFVTHLVMCFQNTAWERLRGSFDMRSQMQCTCVCSFLLVSLLMLSLSIFLLTDNTRGWYQSKILALLTAYAVLLCLSQCSLSLYLSFS